ncbi:hypothetical protein PCIT_a3506 [Pseudoalteromonas citrea]|uniref:Uncharacterized protein n=1 Tax=Pseudoalteromonas citrea TaxID=43655 RepID=A0AAD4AH04_9GAMM|nr:hypothetical protein PCIT_a3506 [Pseudoalteromonas citrea]
MYVLVIYLLQYFIKGEIKKAYLKTSNDNKKRHKQGAFLYRGSIFRVERGIYKISVSSIPTPNR